MNCPKCDENIPVFSGNKTTCKSCESLLISSNGKIINIIFIVVWALTGKLLVLGMSDSLGVAIVLTIIIVLPILLFIRKSFVKYELEEH